MFGRGCGLSADAPVHVGAAAAGDEPEPLAAAGCGGLGGYLVLVLSAGGLGGADDDGPVPTSLVERFLLDKFDNLSDRGELFSERHIVVLHESSPIGLMTVGELIVPLAYVGKGSLFSNHLELTVDFYYAERRFRCRPRL